MAIWKDNTAARHSPSPAPDLTERTRFDAPAKPELAVSHASVQGTRADPGVPRKESLIATDLTIEGKIEGGGSVRISHP